MRHCFGSLSFAWPHICNYTYTINALNLRDFFFKKIFVTAFVYHCNSKYKSNSFIKKFNIKFHNVTNKSNCYKRFCSKYLQRLCPPSHIKTNFCNGRNTLLGFLGFSLILRLGCRNLYRESVRQDYDAF
jgi:hypothetical protein